MFKKSIIIIFLFTCFQLFSSCSIFGNKDVNTNADDATKKQIEKITKKKRFEPNAMKRVDEYDGGIIFGKKKEKDKIDSQNIMWTATLNSLSFIPISSASYNGGVIITDWYTPDGSNESIKIHVSFSSSEIKPSSIEVKAFKRKCNKQMTCKTGKASESFNKKLKTNIFEEVRKLNLERTVQ